MSNLVLCIDDYAEWRETAELLLEGWGYDVLLAKNGAEGIKLFKAHHGKLCLILMEPRMEAGKGFEIAEKLREIDEAVPIVAFSTTHKKELERLFKVKLGDYFAAHLEKLKGNAALKAAVEKYKRELPKVILYVDDTEQVRIVQTVSINYLLKDGNYNAELMIAESGEEAIEKFKEYKDHIALILMDIQMRPMNGVEATREIRKIDKDVPILAFSNTSLSTIKGRYCASPDEFDALFNEYLSKFDDKAEVIARYLK